jgi:membrane-associated phospholipid phosphatase
MFEVLDAIDRLVMPWYNQFARRSEPFDWLVAMLAWNNLTKGGVVMAIFWAVWFGCGAAPDRERRRALLLVALLGAMAATVVTVALTYLLPYRPRPIFGARDVFLVPYGLDASPDPAGATNAFPSDHATLFVGIAFGLVLLARAVGVPLLLYVCVAILFPRLYDGLHYPTDILAGALVGILGTGTAVLLFARSARAQRLALRTFSWAHHRPSAFYGALALVTFEIGILFTGTRGILSLLSRG